MWIEVFAYAGIFLFAGVTVAAIGLWCWLSITESRFRSNRQTSVFRRLSLRYGRSSSCCHPAPGSRGLSPRRLA